METPKLRPHRIPQRQFRLKRIRKVEINLVEIDDVLRTRTRLDMERIARIGGTVSLERAIDVLCDAGACRQFMHPVAEIDDVVLNRTRISLAHRGIDTALYLTARDGDDIARQVSAAPRIAANDVFLKSAARNGDFILSDITCGASILQRAAIYRFFQRAARDRHRIVRHIARCTRSTERTAVNLISDSAAPDDNPILQDIPQRI